ncbi:MAG: 30S ribosomal protein S20 [Candidatus Omnitrophica bacterium]|nr:30S ribosomal protein S20 [Candidatus Omnitrophota bacterium]
MPIKHAALKQIRKDRKRRERNQALRSELKTVTKRLLSLLHAKKLEEAGQLIRVVAKKYDHAASRHIIHRNTAARYKSRLMRRLNSTSSK